MSLLQLNHLWLPRNWDFEKTNGADFCFDFTGLKLKQLLLEPLRLDAPLVSLQRPHNLETVPWTHRFLESVVRGSDFTHIRLPLCFIQITAQIICLARRVPLYFFLAKGLTHLPHPQGSISCRPRLLQILRLTLTMKITLPDPVDRQLCYVSIARGLAPKPQETSVEFPPRRVEREDSPTAG